MFLPIKTSKDSINMFHDPLVDLEKQMFERFYALRSEALGTSSIQNQVKYVHQLFCLKERFPKIGFDCKWRDSLSGSKVESRSVEYEICSFQLRILAMYFNSKQYFPAYRIATCILNFLEDKNIITKEMWDLNMSYILSIQQLVSALYFWEQCTLESSPEEFLQISDILEKSSIELKTFLKMSYDQISETNESNLKNILSTINGLQTLCTVIFYHKKSHSFYERDEISTAYLLIQKAKEKIYVIKHLIIKKDLLTKNLFNKLLKEIEDFYSDLKIQKSFCSKPPTTFDLSDFLEEEKSACQMSLKKLQVPVFHNEASERKNLTTPHTQPVSFVNKDLCTPHLDPVQKQMKFENFREIFPCEEFQDIFSFVIPLEVRGSIQENNAIIEERQCEIENRIETIEDQMNNIREIYKPVTRAEFLLLSKSLEVLVEKIKSLGLKIEVSVSEVVSSFKRLHDLIYVYIEEDQKQMGEHILEVCYTLSFEFEEFKKIQVFIQSNKVYLENHLQKKSELLKELEMVNFHILSRFDEFSGKLSSKISEMKFLTKLGHNEIICLGFNTNENMHYDSPSNEHPNIDYRIGREDIFHVENFLKTISRPNEIFIQNLEITKKNRKNRSMTSKNSSSYDHTAITEFKADSRDFTDIYINNSKDTEKLRENHSSTDIFCEKSSNFLFTKEKRRSLSTKNGIQKEVPTDMLFEHNKEEDVVKSLETEVTTSLDQLNNNQLKIIGEAKKFRPKNDVKTLSEIYFQKYKNYEKFLEDLKTKTQSYINHLEKSMGSISSDVRNNYTNCVLVENASFLESLSLLKRRFLKILRKFKKVRKLQRSQAKAVSKTKERMSRIEEIFRRGSYF